MRRAFFVTLLTALPLFAQESVTPDQLWTAMLQGNKQFVTGKITYDNLEAERELVKGSEIPPITVLACSDSRVPPELAFNQSLGSMFVVRTAGNVVDELGLASIELALSRGWTKLIVVLAHEGCDAVEASLGGADPSTAPMNALAKRIRSSFVNLPYDPADKANVKKATEANARASVAQLLAGSALIRGAAAAKHITIVPAYYELVSGEVKKIE